MSIQPNVSLTNIDLSATIATCFGIFINLLFSVYIGGRNRDRTLEKS